MKHFIWFAMTCLILASCGETHQNSETYQITAEINGIEEPTQIYFQVVEDGELVSVDSGKLEGNLIQFTGSLEYPEMVYLRIGESRKYVNIFAENSDINVIVNIDSLNAAKVTGSRTHDDMIEFSEYLSPIDKKNEELDEAYRLAVQEEDQDRIKEIREAFEETTEYQKELILEFVSKKGDSFISPFIIRRYLSYQMDFDQLAVLLTELDSSVHDSPDYQALDSRVNILQSVAVGQPAKDFALNDSTGNPISISSFQGKYLLIDFWASWCRPCRVENPNVVKLYEDYKDKGFEIIGVSFDRDRSSWIQAIHDDQLNWFHVSDLKGWASEAGKLYAINSIPATVLLDREGTIVAKNLRGDALRKKLEDLYIAEENI